MAMPVVSVLPHTGRMGTPMVCSNSRISSTRVCMPPLSGILREERSKMRRRAIVHQHDKKGHQAHETGDPVIHDALGDDPGTDAVHQHHGSSQVQGPGKQLVGVGKRCKQAQMDVLPGKPEGLNRGPGVPVEVGVSGEGSLGFAGRPGGVVQIDHLVPRSPAGRGWRHSHPGGIHPRQPRGRLPE